MLALAPLPAALPLSTPLGGVGPLSGARSIGHSFARATPPVALTGNMLAFVRSLPLSEEAFRPVCCSSAGVCALTTTHSWRLASSRSLTTTDSRKYSSLSLSRSSVRSPLSDRPTVEPTAVPAYGSLGLKSATEVSDDGDAGRTDGRTRGAGRPAGRSTGRSGLGGRGGRRPRRRD